MAHPEDKPSSVLIDSVSLNREIEIVIRSEFSVPTDYEIAIGPRTPSAYSGFDTLSVTLSRDGKPTTVEFLISRDNTRLARLEEFDLSREYSPPINLAGRPIRGHLAALVTVISFDDLECPFCARMHQEIFPKLFVRYGRTVRFIYKDNPLVAIHPWAMHGAVDANCLAAQNSDAYWHFLDYVHSHLHEINGDKTDKSKSAALLDTAATEETDTFKLDSAKLKACLREQDETQVLASMKEAESLHIGGTPWVIVNGERVSGAVTAEQLSIVIDRALRAAGVLPAHGASDPP